MDELHTFIMKLYPDADTGLSWGMPTYRSGDGWVSIANQKRYISLYTCGAEHLAAFRKLQPGVRTGKGCINLKPTEPLPLADPESVIRSAMEMRKPAK
jgi:uncharacterized protein YdhG (YjbR/CyaY superfamily)